MIKFVASSKNLMSKSNTMSLIPSETIITKIFVLRNEKVMLDFHLSEIYKVENRALKQAVKRNQDLFPKDFMFVLTDVEVELMVSQNVIPSKQFLGGSKPFAFTETGVAMLASVLKSKRAREINIAIMRAFVSLRKLLASNIELHLEIELIKKKLLKCDNSIELLFSYLDELSEKSSTKNPTSRTPIGYVLPNKKA
jgi:ORF6N domain